MNIPYNKTWQFLEKEDYANYLFVVAAWEGYTFMPKAWGFPVGRFLGAEYVNSACILFILKEGNDANNVINFRNLFAVPRLWDKLHRLTKINSDKLFLLGQRIKKLKVAKISNRELFKWIDIFQEGQKGVHVPRGPIWCLETPDNIVTHYLHHYLEEKAGDNKGRVTFKPYEAFQILTTPVMKSLWTQEKEALAKISMISNRILREKRLLYHAKKYEWLEYGLQGKILELNYFRQELNKIRRKGGRRFLADYAREINLLRKKQGQIVREYNIHPRHQKIFKIIQEANFVRLYSKDSQFFGYYCLESLQKEIGRRIGLSLEQVRYLAPDDYKKALIDKQDFFRLTQERQKYSMHLSDKGKTVFYVGQAAKKIRKKLIFYKPKIEAKKTTSLKGQPAYNGRARGRVKIINTRQEMVKMHRGNILVSHMTNPGIVPVMKQAAAIVTDLGGITCHAAIVARELKKPCLIGTKIATQVFKDGDNVEVDVNKGIVKKL